MLTHDEAIAAGFAVDMSAAGRPIAYRGPRFAPTAVEAVYTQHEEELRRTLEAIARTGNADALAMLAKRPAR